MLDLPAPFTEDRLHACAVGRGQGEERPGAYRVRYRRIGTTDVSLSEIGFGCGGNAGLMVRGSAAEQERAVGRAIDLGISYFDNSPDYGDGRAEESLGRALKALRARPLVNSKVEVRAADLGDIAGHVVRSVEASLRRLGVEHIDVLQIHNGPAALPPRLEGPVYTQLWIEDFLRPGGAIEGIERLRRAGKVGLAGFICRGNDGAEVRRLLAPGTFALINVPYSLLNPTAGMPRPAGLAVAKDYGDVIAAARVAGVGAAIYSPLAGGSLTDAALADAARHPLARPDRAAPDEWARTRAQVGQLRLLADAAGLSLAQAAIRFVLMHEGVTTVLGGFSSVEQMEEIVAGSGAPPFGADLMARLEALWGRDLKT
jgi:L-glyceraldehyde 3-phosphate reductase